MGCCKITLTGSRYVRLLFAVALVAIALAALAGWVAARTMSLVLIPLAVWLAYGDGGVRARGKELESDVTARKLQEKELSDLTTTLLVRTCKLEAADEELRQTVERFRSLVDSAKEYAIIMLDAEGLIRTWNPGAQRIKGYRAEEVIGRHFSLFYSEQERANRKPEQELEIAIRDGQFEEDGWRFRADGSRFWANVIITPLRNDQGRVIGFSKISRDLTERIRAEEQANNFFNLSIELLCIAGKDGYFKRLNASWETTLGYTSAELLATPYMDLVHPDDQSRTAISAEQVASGQHQGRFENRYRCKDGTYRWLLWNSALSSDSELIYAAAADITDRKQVEDEIIDLNKALQRQNLKLETTNRELEAFSYSVSHDLRSPLRTIDGFSQAILEDYSDKLDDEGRDHLQRVRGASQRMGQLIDDLLNLSRVARGAMHQETTDLSKIAREVADECLATCHDREVKIAIADNLSAEADPRLLRIVFMNLIGNACKFTMKNPKAVIEIGQTNENGHSEFFVRDNGAGFDMNYAGKLFGPFQRLHSESDFPGTGIGLATVQRIVHRHGGHVRAQSKSGCGATFYFTL
jgi:PAS domain S-box-containing protein